MGRGALVRTYVVVDEFSGKKAFSTTTHDVYYCPYCLQKEIDSGVRDPKPDTSGKLYIHKEKHVGLCFRCNTVVLPARNIDDAFSNLCDSLTNDPSLDINESLVMPDVNLEAFSDASEIPEAMAWFKKRNKFFTKNYIKNADLRYYCQELIDHNGKSYFKKGIVAPMIWKDHIKSYQIRYWTDDHAHRFHTNNGLKLLYIPLPIEPYCELTICEGVYDAHALLMMGFPNVVACLGKSLSLLQLLQLRELLPHTVNFCLDDYQCNGGIAKGLKKKVKTIENYRFFNFPDFSNMDALDPEEFLMKYEDFDYYKKQLKRKDMR